MTLLAPKPASEIDDEFSDDNDLAALAPSPLVRWLHRPGLRKRWFRPSKLGLALAVAFLFVIALCAVFPSLFASGSPTAVNPLAALASPSRAFPLGADQYGRSVYTELVFGARSALEVGVLCTLLGGTVGAALGVIGGFAGGWLDMLVMRLVDVLMALPPLFLALIFIAALAPTLSNEIIAVSIASIPTFARVLRGRALQVRSRLFVDSATVVGLSKRRILWRHVIPNCLAPAMVLAALNVGTAIVIAASLSFLGLGPTSGILNWGALISSGQNYINKQWWIATFPGVLVTLVVIAVNVLGDGLRDAMEPSSR